MILPAVEVAVKVACALALIAPAVPGDALPVRHSSPAPVPEDSPGLAGPVGGGPLSAAQVAEIVRRAGFEPELIETMVAIAYRESRFNPRAVNSTSGACGVFQLLPCPGPQALDPMVNAWLAREKCLASRAAGYSCLRPWGF